MKTRLTLATALLLLATAGPAAANSDHPGFALWIDAPSHHHVCLPGQSAWIGLYVTTTSDVETRHIRANFDSGNGTSVYSWSSGHADVHWWTGQSNFVRSWTSPRHIANLKAFNWRFDQVDGTVSTSFGTDYREKCFGSPIVY